MQYVKRQWLTLYAWLLFSIDIVLLIAFFYSYSTGNEDFASRWGLSPLIAVLAIVHAIYVLGFFPLIRKKNEWVASIISQASFVFILAALIELSQYDNLYIRSIYIIFVFSASLTGPFVPLATVIATWIILLYTYLSVLNALAPNISFRTEIIVDIFVSIAGLVGWKFFKKYYEKNKDAETIALGKLLEQEQFKTTAMLESISDGVMVVNTKGIVQVLNESAASMLGWDKLEALRLDYRSVFRPLENGVRAVQDRDAADIITRSFENKKSEQGTVLLQTKNSRQLFVDVVASPIMETLESSNPEESIEKKQLVGVIAIIRDVDEQKRQEQQKSDFISTASHEMRTPVASIQGYLDLILTPNIWKDTNKVMGYVQKARSTTQHLGELFQDLLTVSQTEDGRLVNNPEPIDINNFLDQTLEPELSKAYEKGIRIINKYNPLESRSVQPNMFVFADPKRLSEVVLNLFDNALKYTKNGSITIDTKIEEEKVYISFTDTGIGIAEEDIPHLFQKFYRTDNSATREVGGTGLGLYLSKQLVEAMGGKILLTSKLGKGSSFSIELPRLKPTHHKRYSL